VRLDVQVGEDAPDLGGGDADALGERLGELGVTVVPQLSVPKDKQQHIVYIPFVKPVPTRRVVLAWRRTFTRYEAIAALRNAIYACPLEGVKRLS
jgi:LysR family hydrogen peroxide-inducible transcriptional activator